MKIRLSSIVILSACLVYLSCAEKPETSPAPNAPESAAEASPASTLKVMPRSAWDTKKSKPTIPESLKQSKKIRIISIHQTEDENSENMSEDIEMKKLRSILGGHTSAPRENNEGVAWGDIAYHYIIGPSGKIYHCRDTSFQSDSVTIMRPDLSGNITICLMGDFRNAKEKAYDKTNTPDQLPTKLALESLVKLLTAQLQEHNLSISAVKAHRELKMIKGGSDCPGELFYNIIKKDIIPKLSLNLKE
jgi:N-acetylmuramoyl-L-alanine amidase